MNTKDNAGLTAPALGAFIASVRYEKLPAPVVQAVKLRVLDTMAAAMHGYGAGSYLPLLSLMPRGDEATALGEGCGLSLRDAVLINGFLAHATYNEDGSRFTGGHPASATIPAALSLGENLKASGRDLIAAIAAGYEVFLRLGGALYPSTVRRGFQSTAVLAPIASAAACASLLKLNAAEAAHALAIATNAAGGMKEALNTPASQPLQVGRGCETGLIAALMAQKGVPGTLSIIDRGLFLSFADEVKTGRLLDGLGETFSIDQTYIKIHGGCRGIHAPVDALNAILRAQGLNADDIASITVEVDTVTRKADIDDPENPEQAQFSVRFAAASCVIFGDASTFRFTREALERPDILKMMEKVTVIGREALDKGFPDKRPAIVTLQTVSGATFTERLDQARGEPENPLTDAEVEEKFFAFTRALGPRASKLHEVMMQLEELGDVSSIVSLVKAGEARTERPASAV